MKKFNRCLASLILVSFITFISCEKNDLDEENPLVSIELKNASDLTNVKPAVVSETRKFGKTVEEFDLSKRVSTLTTSTDWEQITKNEVRAVGIADSEVFNVVWDKYFTNYTPPPFGPAQYYGITSVSIGPSESYGWNRWSQVSNAAIPKYRFYGQGNVSQNTGFALWRRVSSINPQVIPNYLNQTQQIGGNLWITTGSTVSNEYTVEASTAVTAGGKIKVPFVAEGESSVEVTLGTSYTRANEETFQENFYFPLINVPAGKSVRYQLEERWVPVETEWKFPIQFKGNYVAAIEVGFGASGAYLDKRKVNVNAFNSDYDQPGKYHTLLVEEHLSHEFRVAAYIVD